MQYHKKFAVPVFALIMALISVPFGFLVGNRGAMAGIGVSIAIAMAYLGVDQSVRADGPSQLPAGCGRGLDSGRPVLARGALSIIKNAKLKAKPRAIAAPSKDPAMRLPPVTLFAAVCTALCGFPSVCRGPQASRIGPDSG